MPVAIMPGLLVSVVAAGRNELVQQVWKITLQTAFVFNRPDGCCASHIENVNHSGLDARGSDNLRNAWSEIVHVTVARGTNCNLLLMCHSVSSQGLTLEVRTRSIADFGHRVNFDSGTRTEFVRHLPKKAIRHPETSTPRVEVEGPCGSSLLTAAS